MLSGSLDRELHISQLLLFSGSASGACPVLRHVGLITLVFLYIFYLTVQTMSGMTAFSYDFGRIKLRLPKLLAIA